MKPSRHALTIIVSQDTFFCINEDATWTSDGPVVSVLDSPKVRGVVTGDGIGAATVAATVGVVSDCIRVFVGAPQP